MEIAQPMSYLAFLSDLSTALQRRSREYRRLSSPRTTTEFFASILQRMAEQRDLHQAREFWNIDFLWLPSPPSHPYVSAQRRRKFPTCLPAFAIEHENYQVNIGAAFFRVMNVGADRHVVLGWTKDLPSTLEAILAARDEARRGGTFPIKREALVVLLDDMGMTPDSAQAVILRSKGERRLAFSDWMS